MANPTEIARYLLWLASQEPGQDSLTQLRLHKLMYYVQGWSLAKRGRTAFDGRIEAWKHGPVVRQLYPVFKDFGNSAIPSSEGKESHEISPQDRYFLRCVWESYRPFTAAKLWEKTHSERPWREARGTALSDEQCSDEIPVESMKRFFTEETKDEVDFDSSREPDWSRFTNPAVMNSVQSVMARYSETLRRLA